MKKNLIIALLIIIIIMMGIYVYGIQKELTLNDYFDTSKEYSSEWNDAAHEITVHKEFPMKFNQTYENVTTQIDFIGKNGDFESADVVNDTRDGKLTVHATQKLSFEPEKIEFDIHDGALIDSDAAGLDYARQFHLS